MRRLVEQRCPGGPGRCTCRTTGSDDPFPGRARLFPVRGRRCTASTRFSAAYRGQANARTGSFRVYGQRVGRTSEEYALSCRFQSQDDASLSRAVCPAGPVIPPWPARLAGREGRQRPLLRGEVIGSASGQISSGGLCPDGPRRRDGGEPSDDVLDGHAWGEHGDRPRRGRGAFGGPLGDPAQCFAGRADALGPPRPGRARAASFPATVSAVRNPGRMPGRAHAFRAHADCFQRRHISQPGLVLPQCLVGLRPARAFPRGTASPGITILTRKLDTQVSECPAT
jgi:hypothetical protein